MANRAPTSPPSTSSVGTTCGPKTGTPSPPAMKAYGKPKSPPAETLELPLALRVSDGSSSEASADTCGAAMPAVCYHEALPSTGGWFDLAGQPFHTG